MNIYDRDYIREESSGSWFGGARLMVTNLVLANAAVYLFQIVFFRDDPRFVDVFGLKANLFSHPWQFYQLLTYGFVHSPTDIWHIVGNMAILWFLGRDVEEIYGKSAFLQFYLSTIVLAGLAWVVSEQMLGATGKPVVGASGGVMGVAALFVMHFPRRMIYLYFLIPVPIWLIAVVYLTYQLVDAIRHDGAVACSAHLAGAALGYAYYRTRWQLTDLSPRRWAPRRWWKKTIRPPGGVRLHDPPEREDATDPDADLKVEVDRILEKISRQGEASLTTQERRTLEDASRRYQQRKRT